MIIVFDIDEVLNNLLENTYKLAGIDVNKVSKINNYSLSKCVTLTKNELDRIHEVWKGCLVYETAKPSYGIAEIADIARVNGVKVFVHSYCENEVAMRSKIDWVGRYIDTSNIEFIMEVGIKTPLIKADMIVEDNLQYLLECNAETKLLINKPYNQGSLYGIDIDKEGIIRMETTFNAIKYIKELLGLERYSGHKK